MRDWRGQTYAVGSLVLYPRTSGHSLEMCEGRVIEIIEKVEEEPRYENWLDFSERKKRAEADGFDPSSLRRLSWTEDVVHHTVIIMPERTSRFNYGVGIENHEKARQSALERGKTQAEVDKMYPPQKPVRIQITMNITAI